MGRVASLVATGVAIFNFGMYPSYEAAEKLKKEDLIGCMDAYIRYIALKFRMSYEGETLISGLRRVGIG